MQERKNNYTSAMEMPYFYVSSVIRYVYSERKENDDRSSDKIRSDNKSSTEA